MVGAHNPALGFNLGFRTTQSNIYWLSLPYNAAYSTAQNLLDHLNNGLAPTSVSKLVRFDPTSVSVQTDQRTGQYLYVVTDGASAMMP